jgi:mRNA interferase MazF
MTLITRGSIYLADLGGTGSQQQGIRPVVVLQNNVISQSAIKTAIICPLTKNIRNISTHPKINPDQLNSLDHPSAVMCDNIQTINKHKLKSLIGKVSPEDMARVEKSLHLALQMQCRGERN